MLFIYFIEGTGGRKRGKETSMCGCLLCAPYWVPGPQSRHMPWLGIGLVTLWLAGWRSIHWTTPARASVHFNVVLYHVNVISRVAEVTLLKHKLTMSLSMFKGQGKDKETGWNSKTGNWKAKSLIPHKSRKEHFKKEVVGQLSYYREVTRGLKHIQ